MKCNCLDEIKASILNDNEQLEGIQFPVGFATRDGKLNTYIFLNVELKKKGRKTPMKKKIICSYCPFCGTKTGD